MSRTLTLVLTDAQAAYLENEAATLGLPLAGFVESLFEKYQNDPFQKNELLKEFLHNASVEATKHGLKYGPNEVATRIVADWIAGSVFESRKFGKAVSRAPILAGSADLKELYLECLARYELIHKTATAFDKPPSHGGH